MFGSTSEPKWRTNDFFSDEIQNFLSTADEPIISR